VQWKGLGLDHRTVGGKCDEVVEKISEDEDSWREHVERLGGGGGGIARLPVPGTTWQETVTQLDHVHDGTVMTERARLWLKS
jgi:hypothetical protein